MKEKQIEEMAKIIDDNHGFIVSSVETAEALYNAGYRKSTDIAEEIFAEIGELVNEYLDGRIYTHDFCTYLAELKKKYTESEKDE